MAIEKELMDELLAGRDPWAAAGFVDVQLSFHRCLLEDYRAHISDGRVPARWIVEPLDIIKHIGVRLIACTKECHNYCVNG